MFDRRALQAQMVLKGYTQIQIAEELGIDPATMSKKMSSGDFRRGEIEELIILLQIENPVSIFFAPEVADTQEER